MTPVTILISMITYHSYPHPLEQLVEIAFDINLAALQPLVTSTAIE